MAASRLLFAVLLVAFAAPAGAFDVTGTWTGTRKCVFFSGGEKTKVDREGTVAISQDGNAIAFDSAIGSSHLYSGVANFGTEKPDKGELSVHHCRNHDMNDPTPFEALGRFTVSTKTGKVKATIKGITIVANDSVAEPEHGTCKWKLTRTSTTDPAVPTQCGVALSRRAAKTDVAYLSDGEVQRLHDDLLRYRLATYRYRQPEIGPGTRLGFMIDDVAPSPSIAADGNHVDLYAYTTMAVAAVQTQAREIERLKEAVATLTARGTEAGIASAAPQCAAAPVSVE